jgi:hypothetical protein
MVAGERARFASQGYAGSFVTSQHVTPPDPQRPALLARRALERVWMARRRIIVTGTGPLMARAARAFLRGCYTVELFDDSCLDRTRSITTALHRSQLC